MFARSFSVVTKDVCHDLWASITVFAIARPLPKVRVSSGTTREAASKRVSSHREHMLCARARTVLVVAQRYT